MLSAHLLSSRTSTAHPVVNAFIEYETEAQASVALASLVV